MKSLELFKGTGSFGKVAKKYKLDNISLDLEEQFKPDIQVDILKWKYKEFFKNFVPDLIWASPPCNTYSPLAYPLKERDTKTAEPFSDRAKLGTKILYRTLKIIQYALSLNPNLIFVMENPRGMMRYDTKVKKLLVSTATYCNYGDVKWKPTDFFNNLPDGLELDYVKRSECKKYKPITELTLKERYSIPSKLIDSILKQMMESYKKLIKK
jgi:site-specific DNA-cytosine methylase